jgi:hypothetical protein
MKTVIVDLDHTLCDATHRQHLGQAGDWEGFHSQCKHDEPHADVRWLLDLLPDDVFVLAVTGRSDPHWKATIDWLNKHSIRVDDILMRPQFNYVPDHELKLSMTEEYFGSKEAVLQNVIFVLDDRDKVVEAWRNYGLPCWQVRPGVW